MKGGVRPGAGRPTKADEEKVMKMAQGAIVKKYGSLEKGFKSLLDGDSDMMKKFVWEHAVGKPREKIDLDTNLPPAAIIGMIFSDSPKPMDSQTTDQATT